MRVLVACEESQRVAMAFREYGHLAFSCDIKPCSGGFPQYHFQDDCKKVILNHSWDMIIAHPPCTYLAVSGACNLVDNKGNIKNYQRYEKMLEAREFFYWFWNLRSSEIKLCLENPRPMKRAGLPPHTQVIQPFEFGENYSKQTLLWLHNLPYLIPECYSTLKRKFGESWCAVHKSACERSKTFQGIANAMAKQWNY